MHGRVNAIQDPKTGVILEQVPMPELECAAFEGGGVACISYAGAIAAMEKLRVLETIKYVSGVSGGAIAALAVCLGCTAEEITDILLEMPMEEFMPSSDPWWFTPQILTDIGEFIRLWKRYGSDYAKEGADKFKAWLGKIVEKKLGNAHATNFDLDARIAADMREFGKTKFKKIYVGSVKLSVDIPYLKIFGSDTNEEIELAQMIFMSACHPLLWGAADWKGDLWTDGGVKSIILLDHFDEDRFHPKTPGRINAGVIGIKIDTQNEIDQIIWNKSIRAPIKSTSQFALKVLDATSHTVDKQKTQRTRNIIALSDGGVDRLTLKLGREKRLELIANAEVTAREYFENHMYAAYELLSYPNSQAWFARRPTSEDQQVVPEWKVINHLIVLKRAYQAMLNELLESDGFDDMARCDALMQILAFIDDYRNRVEQEGIWNGEGVVYPPHIDLPPEAHTAVWHAEVEASLKRRLASVQQKIACFEPEYRWLCCHYAQRIDEVFPEAANYGWRSEEALRILMCEEYLERLRIERDDIECKLGMKCDHHFKEDVENSKMYMRFYQEIHKLNEQETAYEELTAIKVASVPFLSVTEEGDSPFSFQLDMRRAVDRKLYLIAALIFMTYHKSYELEKIKKIAEEFVPDYVHAATHLDGFIKALGLMVVEVHPALFKLEALLHYFEKKRYPRHQPVLNVDTLFKLPGGSFFAKPAKPINVVAMSELKPALWRENIRLQLEARRGEIKRAKSERERLMAYLRDYFTVCAPCESFQNGQIYLHAPHSEWLQMLVAYDECIRQWEVECAELACQLRVDCGHIRDVSKLNKNLYATFNLKMVDLNADAGLSYALRAVMPEFLPVVDFYDDQAFPFKFRLDLRDPDDRKIYLIAGLMYLEYRRYDDLTRFKEIFHIMVGADSAPKSMRDLMDILNCDAVSAQVAMFRIECLLHCFDRKFYVNPAYKSTLDLDTLWGLPKVVVSYEDVTLKQTKPQAVMKPASEMKPKYQLTEERAARPFVAQMAAYTENHDEDEETEELLMARSLRLQRCAVSVL